MIELDLPPSPFPENLIYPLRDYARAIALGGCALFLACSDEILRCESEREFTVVAQRIAAVRQYLSARELGQLRMFFRVQRYGVAWSAERRRREAGTYAPVSG